MWTGLTQIGDIDKCENQLSANSGTQWHWMMRVRLVIENLNAKITKRDM